MNISGEGQYINTTLNKFTANQIIEMAEKFNAGAQGYSEVMMKIFEKMEKEYSNTEYEKTEVEDRKHRLNY